MKYEELLRSYRSKKEAFYRDAASAYIEPFKVAGPVYYVGDKQVCVHLIDTGEGLLLIDSGFPHTVSMLIDSIGRLGFKPEDVKAILHTHGHYDHFGASAAFKKLFGTELAISRREAETLEKSPAASCIGMCAELIPTAEIPRFDRYLEDGEVFSMGNVKIRCMLLPGHSVGNMGFFFDVKEEGSGKKLRVGTFGGVGLGSARRCSLREYGLDEKLSSEIFTSIEKAAREKVDVVLGNHPYNNRTLEKRRLQLEQGGNPFVDGEMWQSLLDNTKIAFEKMLAEEKND